MERKKPITTNAQTRVSSAKNETRANPQKIDLSDIESVLKLPKSACGDVNRAILALPDKERVEFLARYLEALPELVPDRTSTSAMGQLRPCHGAFVGLIFGIADLVDDEAAIVKLCKTISPEMVSGEFLANIRFRHSVRAEKPFNPDDINAGFFRIRGERSRILKTYEETKFREKSFLQIFREMR